MLFHLSPLILRILWPASNSNDVFSRCKSVHKMATGKSDDELIQYDNKLELETSYKMKLGPKVEN